MADDNDRERERGHPLPRHLDVGDEGEERTQPEKNGEEMCEVCEEPNDDRGPPKPLDAVGSELEPPDGGLSSRKAGRCPEVWRKRRPEEAGESASFVTRRGNGSSVTRPLRALPNTFAP